MNFVWKILLPLALLLPAVGYVAGALASSDGGNELPRETIVIDQSSQDTPADPAPQDQTGKKKGDDDRGKGKDDRSGSDRGSDDARPDDDDDVSDDVDEVQPEPDDWTDDDGGGHQTRTRTRGDD